MSHCLARVEKHRLSLLRLSIKLYVQSSLELWYVLLYDHQEDDRAVSGKNLSFLESPKCVSR